MESVSSAGNENNARAARDAALTHRPPSAPLPKSVVSPVDNEPCHVAALQYFEAAQRFYRDGDHTRGDYCILRGDMYLLLASIATRVNSMGVSPLLNEKSAYQSADAVPSTEEELEAKLQQLQNFLEENPLPVPGVPAEASNASQCDYFTQEALHCVDQAVAASEEGNTVAVYYWMDEAQSYEVAHDYCVLIEEAISH
jgi:hypothetical protein